jgi:hypothetical protein
MSKKVIRDTKNSSGSSQNTRRAIYEPILLRGTRRGGATRGSSRLPALVSRDLYAMEVVVTLHVCIEPGEGESLNPGLDQQEHLALVDWRQTNVLKRQALGLLIQVQLLLRSTSLAARFIKSSKAVLL